LVLANESTTGEEYEKIKVFGGVTMESKLPNLLGLVGFINLDNSPSL